MDEFIVAMIASVILIFAADILVNDLVATIILGVLTLAALYYLWPREQDF